ncbi:MAG: hypothetical protein CME40_04435 [Haliea sp.]|nr:hypothetical protein [Haliea sp.]
MNREAMENALRQGLSRQRAGDLPSAARWYESVLQQAPEQVTALHYLGLTRFQQGQLSSAENLLRRALAQRTDNANAWSDLGMVLLRRGQPEASIEAFSKALSLAPDHPDALHNKAQALRQLGRFDQARPLLEHLLTLKPKSASARYLLANVQHRANDLDAAIPAYREALRLAPGDKRIRLGLGDALESSGQFSEAREHYDAVLAADPDSPLALARLLQMRDREPAREQVRRAETLADNPATPEDGRVRLNIGLGYYHDRQQQFETAFQRLQAGYEVLARRAPFDSDGYSRAVDKLIEALPKSFFESAPNSGLDSERPIFIVGMPRSGTTLTEQILASHSQVAAGGELSSLLKVSYRIGELSASGKPYPAGLRSVAPPDLRSLAEDYLRQLDRVAPQAARVTDKLPFNFMHLGVIALLFPRARIIHCHRHPLDNCVSCYFTSFADQIRFANRLDTLGRYYVDYHRLMTHWKQALPLEIFDLRYEDLVTNTEDRIRALLGHCDLPFEDSCLRFYQTERGVRTPSRWQVRQPIYAKSVGRWRNYQQQLAPLAEILAPVLGAEENQRG